MKKSLLNIAITMAMSGILLSTSVLNAQAYADTLDTTESVPLVNNSNNAATHENYMFPGIGVGAATGAVVAGPAGLLIGGIIGALVGSNQAVTQDSEEKLQQNITATSSLQETTGHAAHAEESKHSVADQGIYLAQTDSLNTVIDDSLSSPQNDLINALTTDLSLDVYFRSGSTDIESFYHARLAAIADLMKTIDALAKNKLELHLDGYTDRRGNKTQNIALANERIEKIREQLINAGIDETRIISKAFGEMKMVSSAGDLEGYNFDRKVVIRFQRTSPDSIQSMTTALSEFETQDTSASDNNEDTGPVFSDATTQF
jgi:outer membrane protein OmpA-like peptidoglycan-associated protein